MSLPKLSNQEPIINVDATPDSEYPLRILKAHRQNCNIRWESNEPHPLIDAMNEVCDKRAEILDRAIAVLEEHCLVEPESNFREHGNSNRTWGSVEDEVLVEHAELFGRFVIMDPHS